MHIQNISDESSGNVFAGFLEWDMFKLIYLIFHIALTFSAPPILYSIVWYERFGSGLHYSSDSQPGVRVPLGVRELLVGGTRNVENISMIPF